MKKIILFTAICAMCTGVQSQSWKITGNAGTNASNNFIGTSDNKNFKIRTNNVIRINITYNGKIALGDYSPAFKLDVKGGSINTDSVYRIGGKTMLSVNGTDNTFVGINCGSSNTTGYSNTAIGQDALFFNTTGDHNTANGKGALYHNTTGYYNTATGLDALYFNTTGIFNSAYGFAALYNNTSGAYNTAYGEWTLRYNSTGNSNTAIGSAALLHNTTGIQNTAIGDVALQRCNTASYNTAVGCGTLYFNNGYENTAIGFQSLFSNTIGSHNTANGDSSLYYNKQGSYNSANSYAALKNNTTGTYNTANGVNSLMYNITGNFNSAFGSNAFFGSDALNNTSCVGYQSGGVVNTSDRIELGNTSVSVIAGEVGFSTYSDARIKDNVKEDVPGLDFISRLHPVTYNLNVHRENEMLYKGTGKDLAVWDTKYDIEKIKMTGFLAQDVEKAAKETGYDFSGVQKPANPNELYSLRYSDFVMPLVKAVQELSSRNEEQDKLIQYLKSEIENLKSDSKQTLNSNSLPAILFQNSPNPFYSQTEIKFQLPESFNSAKITINDRGGKQIKTYELSTSTSLIIKEGELSAGTYLYSLIVDGIKLDSKQMVITK